MSSTDFDYIQANATVKTIKESYLFAVCDGRDVFVHRTAFIDVKDGLSTTLLILESTRDNGHWGQGGPATLRG